MSAPPLCYAELFSVLLELNPGTNPETLNARVKSWQKMGVPAGCNVGRGVRAQYHEAAVLEVSVFNELTRIGFTPAVAKQMLADRNLLAEWGERQLSFEPDPHSFSIVVIDTARIKRALDRARACPTPLPSGSIEHG